MRIALAGTRGVPAAYSGFETAVEQIGSRLVARGHTVTVYCRPHMVGRRPDGTYRGMRLVYLPTVPGKHLDTPVHTLLSTVHLATVDRPDAVFYFIAGNSPFAGLGRALGVPTAINVDGLDSQRAKWGPLARAYLRLTERAAPSLACVAITDSRTVQTLYRSWGHETVYIPYGSELDEDDAGAQESATGAGGGAAQSDGALARLGLEERGYVLFVGRLVPENNAHVLVEAFRGLHTSMRLAVVGDAPYAGDYQARLRAAGDDRVVFAGYQFGAAYRELLRNAALVAVPTEVGGTHPVILEALAAGACLVVNDHAPNLETVGDAGVSYRGADGAEGLRRALEALLADPGAVERYRAAAVRRARLYSWDAVTDAYERLAERLTEQRRGGRAVRRPAR
ncbi:MAG TPA: glycosyltransferase [Thermoleophilia bacterium]|nr:glycosyltransferase [Thermoleophilia bacterium]